MQVREDDAADLPRGTRITLHLKDDAAELADAGKLGSLVKQYSEFIQFPIKLWSSNTEYDQARARLAPSQPAWAEAMGTLPWPSEPLSQALSHSMSRHRLQALFIYFLLLPTPAARVLLAHAAPSDPAGGCKRSQSPFLG